MTHKTSTLPLFKKNFGHMSHFRCSLNRCFFGIPKKLNKLSKLGGGKLDKIQKNRSFFRESVPKVISISPIKSALGMSGPICGPLIHNFVGETYGDKVDYENSVHFKNFENGVGK